MLGKYNSILKSWFPLTREESVSFLKSTTLFSFAELDRDKVYISIPENPSSVNEVLIIKAFSGNFVNLYSRDKSGNWELEYTLITDESLQEFLEEYESLLLLSSDDTSDVWVARFPEGNKKIEMFK